MKPFSLYIHVPFCLKKCPYCAFYKRKWDPSLESDFLNALELEAKRVLEWMRTLPDAYGCDTVFIGGGTPNALTPASFERMLTIAEAFLSDVGKLERPIEKTIELNPEAVTPTYLSLMKNFGYDRASVGIQSFHPHELKQLGRIHTVKTIYQAVDIIKSSHLRTWNMDFMFGFPESTWASVEASLDQAMTVAPPHISLYALSIEPGTLYEKHGIQPVPQEKEADQYRNIMRYLKKQGYKHYEVSAFAKPGHECRHNKTYWTYGEFIGLGPSADSFIRGAHSKNVANISAYQRRERLSIERAKPIDVNTQKVEYLICNLRLIQGFLLTDYQHRFKAQVWDDFPDIMGRFLDKKLLRVRKGRLMVTQKGLMVLNEILLAFV